MFTEYTFYEYLENEELNEIYKTNVLENFNTFMELNPSGNIKYIHTNDEYNVIFCENYIIEIKL